MNKSYVYKDGKVLVYDENGVTKSVEYCDNIEARLVQENAIETIDKRIKKIEQELDEIYPKKYTPMCFYIIFAGLLLFTIISAIMSIVNPNMYIGSITIFHGLSLPMPVLILPLALVGLLDDFFYFLEYKHNQKIINGDKSELDCLNERIVVEKEKLKELIDNQCKTIIDNPIDSLNVTKIDDYN